MLFRSKLDSKVSPTRVEIAPYDSGDVLDVANPNSEVWAAPYSEVKEEVSHYLPVLLTVVAKQLNQVLNNCKSLYCDECRRDLRGRGEMGKGESSGKWRATYITYSIRQEMEYLLQQSSDDCWTFCQKEHLLVGGRAIEHGHEKTEECSHSLPLCVCERGRLRLYVATGY